MLGAMESYVSDLNESITRHYGKDRVSKWTAELDRWEEKVSDHKKHKNLKVPFEPPPEAGA